MAAKKLIPLVAVGLAVAIAAVLRLWPKPAGGDAMRTPSRGHPVLHVRLDAARDSVDVEIGPVEYGTSLIRTLRIVASDAGLRIDSLRRLGCAACSKTKVIHTRWIPEEGVLECKLVFNKDPLTDSELGDHEDRFAVVSDNQDVLGVIRLKHSIALSQDVRPGRIVIAQAVPDQTYCETLYKNSPFAVRSVATRDSRIRVVEWRDMPERLQLRLSPAHSYANERVSTDLLISRHSSGRLVVPLIADIQETITVQPRQVCFVPATRGETLKHLVRIASKAKLNVAKCDTDHAFASCKIVANGAHEKVLQVSVAVDGSMPEGPFTTHLRVYWDSVETSVVVPVYGVVLSAENGPRPRPEDAFRD